MPIQIKRTYQQGDVDVRPFGVGTNFDYGMFPWSPGEIGNFDFQQFDLVQPDGSKIHYQDLGYQYDGAGQPIRTTGSYSRTQLPAAFGPATYDPANRIETIAGVTVSHDADGNLTSDGTTAYTWNDRGELAGLSRTGLTATFGYATDGRRLGRAINSATTNYLYDGPNPLQEKVNGAVTATMTSAGTDGWQLRESGGTTKRHLTDALGSTLGLVDNAGAGASYAYEPFGATTVDGNDDGNPYRYTGREDDGTGLYYSPTLQRFISEDPIGLASGDTNPYAYVFDHPTALSDPMGTKPAGSRVEYLRDQQLPAKAGPWKKYQEHVTGRSYESVWRVNGQQTQVDGGPKPFVVEAKWAGRNDAAFQSSPYHPSNFFNEQKFVDQARRLLDLNQGLGGSGVRYAVSSPSAARDLLMHCCENGSRIR